ncbi:unnamed protein product [Enterobius vermicularis]|uniref:Nucleoside transporter n=1 Tax=Enterobius vermicularis TaxID=51028 RepID=A0A0N4VD78_ENTVE|nr:unnamed protein product [Enterobius vermicularis]
MPFRKLFQRAIMGSTEIVFGYLYSTLNFGHKSATLTESSLVVAAFFFFTMFTVVILSAANGIYQNSIYGLVAAFPSKFTNAVVLGNNIFLVFEGSVTDAALAYFIISITTIILCFISLLILPRLDFYKYYMRSHKQNREKAALTCNDSKAKLYTSTFKQCWVQCLSIFLVFTVTLTIFPGIMANVKPFHQDKRKDSYDFIIPEKLFTPITTFLLFNVFALVGSATANRVHWPSPRFIIIPSALRLLFIPTMMFCNFRPERRTWPVLIPNEYVYIMFAIIMSFTSGYLSSLGMMYASKVVEPSKAPIAGMMAAFSLASGM